MRIHAALVMRHFLPKLDGVLGLVLALVCLYEGVALLPHQEYLPVHPPVQCQLECREQNIHLKKTNILTGSLNLLYLSLRQEVGVCT